MSENTLSCGACNKQETDTLKLQRCGRCKNEAYCGGGCQTKHWPAHKAHCKRPNYVLRFDLWPETIVNPPIWRTLSCPADATFDDLHEALQIAFGYASTHTYECCVKDVEAERQAEEEEASSENAMLDMMQKLMGTTGKDVDESFIGTRSLLRVVDPDHQRYIDNVHAMHRRHRETPEKMADQLKLHQVLDKASYANAPFQYEYDFGDNWEPQISRLPRAEKATDFFQCPAGEGHGVAEDVGSKTGWEDLKKAYRSQRPNDQQKEKMRWFENLASNEDRHGLNNGRDRQWPKTKVNSRLSELAGKVVGFT